MDEYDLLFGQEPDARAQAAAMANALRRKQMGAAMFSAVPVTAGLGKALEDQAKTEAQGLEHGLTARLHYGPESQNTQLTKALIAAQGKPGPMRESKDMYGTPVGTFDTRTGERKPFAKTLGGGTPASGPASKEPLPPWLPKGFGTDEAKAAEHIALTGALPTGYAGFGKIGQPRRDRAFHLAAMLYPDASWADNKQDYVAKRKALMDVTSRTAMLDAAETTARKNIQIFIDAARKVKDTGSPLFNRPIRELSRSLGGSPEMAAFNASRLIATTETARVLMNLGQGGVLSDTARKEAESLLKEDLTVEQALAAAEVLDKDFDNRRAAYHGKIKELTEGRPASVPKLGVPTATPAAAVPPTEQAPKRRLKWNPEKGVAE